MIVRCASLLLFCSLILNAGEPTPAPAKAPAAAVRPSIVSPEFLSDGSVTFRLLAPQAQTVTVDGEWWPNKETPLTKGENGVWSVTIKVPPEIYQYRFTVDGAAVPDPNNRYVKPGHFPHSLIDIPAETPRPFDPRPDVPRGSVVEHRYFSKSLGVERKLRVYCPPGKLKSDDKLPVLLLLHGSTDCEASWTTQGRADVIADNLLAEGKMKPMLIVMPDGHAEAKPGPSSRNPADRSKMYERLEADIFNEILPLVEKTYRVKTDSKHRAMVGLSMGGAQTLKIGLGNVEKFGWIGVYSQGILSESEDVLAKHDKFNEQLEWFWIGMGKDDSRAKRATDLSEKLTKMGVHHEYELTEGAHTWILWRQYLHKTLQRLFK